MDGNVLIYIIIKLFRSAPRPRITRREAKLFLENDLPFNRDVLFSDHDSVPQEKIKKRQTILLKKVFFLKNILKEDEEIILITSGYSPIAFHELGTYGILFRELKSSLFVFTNKRLFHIPTKTDCTYRSSIAQILYNDCKTILIKGKKLIVDYKNGGKEIFPYIANQERTKLKVILQTISFEGPPSINPKRTHLCPRCTNELEDEKYICQNCKLEFKNKEFIKGISILFPGGGHFYTPGHYLLGIIWVLVEIYLIYLLIKPTTADEITTIVSLVAVVLLLIGVKDITIYLSKRSIEEYIPVDKKIEPIS